MNKLLYTAHKKLLLCLIFLFIVVFATYANAELSVYLAGDKNTGAINITSFVPYKQNIFYTYNGILFKTDGNTSKQYLISSLADNSDENQEFKNNKLLICSGNLYLINMDTGKLYALKQNNTLKLVKKADLDWQDYIIEISGGFYSDAPKNVALTNLKLYAIEENMEQGKQLISFDLASGKKTQETIEQVVALAPYSNEQVIIAKENNGNVDIGFYGEGGFKPLEIKLPFNTFGIGFSGNSFFAGAGNEIIKIDSDKNTYILGELPEGVYSCSDFQVNDYGAVFLKTNLGLLKYTENLKNQKEQKLTVWGHLDSSAALLSAGEIPGLKINTAEPESFETLMQNLISRNNEIDIYKLSISYIDFESVKSKGFFVDLSGSPQIKEYFDGLYPSIRAALSLENQICAVPIRAETTGLSLYNKDFFDKENIKVPSTFEELCAFIKRWDELYTKKYPDMQPIESSFISIKHTLVQEAFREWLAYCQKDSAGFDISLLKQLLQNAEDATENLKQNEAETYKNACILGMHSNSVKEFEGMILDGQTLKPMLLSAYKDYPYAITMKLDVLMINPFSKNKDLSMKFIENMLRHLPEHFNTMVLENKNEPILNLYYSFEVAEKTETIKLLKKQMEESENIYKTELQDKIDKLCIDLESYKKEKRFFLSPDAINTYRAAMGDPLIENGGLMQALDLAINPLLKRYSDGNINLEQFVSEAQNKIKIILAEFD